MCCFSGPVEDVSGTKIFARFVGGGRQALVYSMSFSAGADLAMVLPIPTPQDSPEDAVRFVSFEGYPTFFDDLFKAFPPPPSNSRGRGETDGASLGMEPRLEVVQVGAFEASFVPKVADFARLDERFRLPAPALAALTRGGRGPDYSTWGFCVFKLRKGEEQHVHPLAFSFPSRTPRELFFPTVHVHDGTAPAQARFDHTLYFQMGTSESTGGSDAWVESPGVAGSSVQVAKTFGFVAADQHLYKRTMQGRLANEDTLVELK